jgi:flagellar hook-associated protein 3 FlgL
LVGLAADGLRAQADRVTGIRADLGHAEERIERSSVRIASELSSLDYARSQLLAVDPFEAATELENVQFQLEALYTVTARAARLNLVNFLS